MATLVLDPSQIKTEADLALYAQQVYALAREDFWTYRQLINPRMLRGWFQRDVAHQLQKFWENYKRGARPKLLLQSPPQHGKSYSVIDFLSWIIGHDPGLATIFASYSDRLGIRANLRLQRILLNPTYAKVFAPRLNIEKRSTVAQLRRNSEIIEFIGGEGQFRNTTIQGQITGEGLDIGIIDDPIKGRAEASSENTRDKTWDWLTDDFMTRFSDLAALLMIMTRWHIDDPAGRMIEAFPDMVVLRYPALAEQDEANRKEGEPLFPEHKSLPFLLKQKSAMTQSGWESVYQQNPIIVGGGLFPIEKFGETLRVKPAISEVRRSVRYFDKAGTEGGGAYTAGVLIHEMRDGRFVVSHVVRGQWGAFDRETRIKQTAEADNSDGWHVDTWVEQEPGSGGKESAERTVVNLAGFNVYKDRVRGNKELRAEPYAAQVQAGNVRLVAGQWNQDFLDEHETFPNGKYKDQVDAAGGAFAKVVGRRFEEPTETGLPIFGSAET